MFWFFILEEMRDKKIVLREELGGLFFVEI